MTFRCKVAAALLAGAAVEALVASVAYENGKSDQAREDEATLSSALMARALAEAAAEASRRVAREAQERLARECQETGPQPEPVALLEAIRRASGSPEEFAELQRRLTAIDDPLKGAERFKGPEDLA